MVCEIPVISRVEKLIPLEGHLFDQEWLLQMANHHLDAIKMSQYYISRVVDPHLASHIRSMIETQTREAEEMMQLLGNFKRYSECMVMPTSDAQFVVLMTIHHHTGNIMSMLALQKAHSAGVILLAEKILREQRNQIKHMKDTL